MSSAVGREVAEQAMREAVEQVTREVTENVARQVTEETVEGVVKRVGANLSESVANNASAVIRDSIESSVKNSVDDASRVAVGDASKSLIQRMGTSLNPSEVMEQGMRNAVKEAGEGVVTKEMLERGTQEAVESQLRATQQAFGRGMGESAENSIKALGVSDDVAKSVNNVVQDVSTNPSTQDNIVRTAEDASSPAKVTDSPDIKQTRTLGDKVKTLLKENWGKVALMGVAIAATVITLQGGSPLKRALEAGGSVGEAIANTLADVLWAVIGPVLNALKGVWNWFKKWGWIIFSVVGGLILLSIGAKIWSLTASDEKKVVIQTTTVAPQPGLNTTVPVKNEGENKS